MQSQTTATAEYHFRPIGIIHSCYKQKFGIPRQPGLVDAASGILELLPPYNRADAVKGLEGFSHLWIQFVFHLTQVDSWRTTVRPPRLGGNDRVGVFASRATHRPNPLGLSVVKLEEIIINDKQGVQLKLNGLDLVDQTPVLDIKPYIPYADSLESAQAGFAEAKPPQWPVFFSDDAANSCKLYEEKTGRPLQALIEQVLAQDPRPAYHARQSEQLGRLYGLQLWDQEIKFRAFDEYFQVEWLEPVP